MPDTTQAALVALKYEDTCLKALDQTELPFREVWLELRSSSDVADAIRRLAIRGAPLIGVAGAYGVALALARDPDDLDRACAELAGARPTAVNLTYGVERVRAAVLAHHRDRAAAALDEARAVEADELAASEAMARFGADWLSGRRRILTHCNAGALAAPGRGTALAPIAELHIRGELDSVLACEARPLLQGARLTVYELRRLGIAHALIVDSAAAGLIARGEVDAVVTGCDRVAANGDVANKVGTFGLALAAAHAGIAFVVVGPSSTIDASCADGDAIVIEERDAEEVRGALGTRFTVDGTICRNPAFDVTPARLVTALVTDRGVASPVDAESVIGLLRR